MIDSKYQYIVEALGNKKAAYEAAITELEEVGGDVEGLEFDKVFKDILRERFHHVDTSNLPHKSLQAFSDIFTKTTSCIKQLTNYKKIMDEMPPLDYRFPELSNELEQTIQKKEAKPDAGALFEMKNPAALNVKIKAIDLVETFDQAGKKLFEASVGLTKAIIKKGGGPAREQLENLSTIIEHASLFQQNPRHPAALGILTSDARKFHARVDRFNDAEALNVSKNLRKLIGVGFILLGILTGPFAIMCFPIAYNLLKPTPGMRTKDAMLDLLAEADKLLKTPAMTASLNKSGKRLPLQPK